MFVCKAVFLKPFIKYVCALNFYYVIESTFVGLEECFESSVYILTDEVYVKRSLNTDPVGILYFEPKNRRQLINEKVFNILKIM